MTNTPHRSTQRALDILGLLAGNPKHAYSLAEISSLLEAPKSSLFPILQTLVQNEYVTCYNDSLCYTIGIKAFETGMSYIQGNASFESIQEEMQKIVTICSETCNVAQLIGNEVCYLFKVDSPEPIRMFSAPGKRMPAHSTSLGKALLSEKTREELDVLFPEGLIRITDNTITDMDVFYEQLKQVRSTGIAQEIEENELMIRCFAVPIRVNHYPAYAVSVSVPLFRYTQEKERLIIQTLKAESMHMEALLSAWNMEASK